MTYFPNVAAPIQVVSRMDDMCVKLLCHCDGTEGQQSVTDNSLYGFSGTVSGNAHITTSSPQFGTGCLFLDGNDNSKVVFANPNGYLNFGVDFTISTWFKIPSGAPGGTKSHVLLAATDAAANTTGWLLVTAGQLGPSDTATAFTFWFQTDEGWIRMDTDVAHKASLDAWHHIAICRDNNFMYFVLDGLVHTNMWRSFTRNEMIYGNRPYIRLGHSLWNNGTYGNNVMYGYLDEVYINCGRALYKAGNFDQKFPTSVTMSVPSQAYANPSAISPASTGTLISNGSDSLYFRTQAGTWGRIEDIPGNNQRYLR